ncbi:hypothetical protein [Cyclobacterium roseum]|uniref:hypothetical protein n=1 Tax=Cyclobacterium roseum TaxID=2666137 RepID=UPI001391398D|nr:hypothetical protein [Cyclobacterium roseum]
MKFIDDLLGGLFPRKDSKVSIKENFNFSGKEEAQVASWMDSEEGRGLMKTIYDNYHLKIAGVNKQPEVHVLHSPYANGFAVSFQEPLTPSDFGNLFIGWGLGMPELGYRKVSLDRKIEESNEQVKVTEKYYFKPPLSAGDLNSKIDQLFGNVSIEKIFINNRPSYLKVLATVYADSLYHEAAPFDRFMDQLFNQD